MGNMRVWGTIGYEGLGFVICPAAKKIYY